MNLRNVLYSLIVFLFLLYLWKMKYLFKPWNLRGDFTI